MQSQYQTLCCPICMVPYNKNNKTPRIITVCGHTICLECLMQILKRSKEPSCPLDTIVFSAEKRTIESFPVNFGLLSLIEEISAEELCEDHQERRSLICFTDKTIICQDCAFSGRHKGHDIESIKQVRNKVNNLKLGLEIGLQNFDRRIMQLKGIIEKALINTKEHIEFRFGEEIKRLKKKEKEILEQADNFFKLLSDKLDTDSNMRQEILKSISDCATVIQQKDFIDFQVEPIDSLYSRLNSNTLNANVETLKECYEKSRDAFNECMNSQIPSICTSNLLINELPEILSIHVKKFMS